MIEIIEMKGDTSSLVAKNIEVDIVVIGGLDQVDKSGHVDMKELAGMIWELDLKSNIRFVFVSSTVKYVKSFTSILQHNFIINLPNFCEPSGIRF